MKANWKNNVYVCGGLALFTVGAALITFYLIVTNFEGVGAVLSTVADVLLPFIVGLALAYLLAPIYDMAEQLSYRWFAGKGEQPRRFAKGGAKVAASAVSVLFLLALIAGLLSLVVPQAYISIANLVASMPDKTRAVITWIESLPIWFGNDSLTMWLSEGLSSVTNSLSEWAQNDLLPNLGNIAKDLSVGVIGVIGTVTNVFIGVIICVYTLNSKQLFKAQAKKVLYALFKTPTANYLVNMTRYMDKTFGRYINGMLLDALMVGILCFVFTSICGVPYALLISAIVGLFNIVPIFGPITAAILCTFFVLLESPIHALIFLIGVLVLQQIDGNILAPKILGERTGLSGFWVIFAIVVGGGLFGIVGMILGVPAFAVVYMLIQQALARRLREKHIPDHTGAYDKLWEIDPDSGEPLYGVPHETEE
ncbi:MAG: AI-2E family transporter [Clostridia bacterium]|nr:AI-2E family transporter [Clostridia bacterium]